MRTEDAGTSLTPIEVELLLAALSWIRKPIPTRSRG